MIERVKSFPTMNNYPLFLTDKATKHFLDRKCNPTSLPRPKATNSFSDAEEIVIKFRPVVSFWARLAQFRSPVRPTRLQISRTGDLSS